MTSSESSLNQLEQYGKDNNMVIIGVLNEVTDDQLEKAVVKILLDVDCTVKAGDMRLAVDLRSHIEKL